MRDAKMAGIRGETRPPSSPAGENAIGPRTRARPPCPDPLAPNALQRLFGAWFERMWEAAHDEALTKMDIANGFGAARLAAGIGKEPPAPAAFTLPMSEIYSAGAPKATDSTPSDVSTLNVDAPIVAE